MIPEHIYYRISRWLSFNDQLNLALTCKTTYNIITSAELKDDRNAWSIKKYNIKISVEEIIKREDPQLLKLQNNLWEFDNSVLLVIGLHSEKLAFNIFNIVNSSLKFCFALKYENVRLLKKISKSMILESYLPSLDEYSNHLIDKIISEKFFSECLKTRNGILIKIANTYRLYPDRISKFSHFPLSKVRTVNSISNQTKQSLKNLRKTIKNDEYIDNFSLNYFNYYSVRELKYLFGINKDNFMKKFLEKAILRKESPNAICYCQECQNQSTFEETSHFNHDNSRRLLHNEKDEKYIKTKYIVTDGGFLIPKKTWSFKEAKEFNNLYRNIFRKLIQNANDLPNFENNIQVMKDNFPDIYTDNFILEQATLFPKYAKYVVEYLPNLATNIVLSFIKVFRISEKHLISDEIIVEYIRNNISDWPKYFDKIKSEKNKKSIALKIITFFRNSFPNNVSEFLSLLDLYPEFNDKPFYLSMKIYPIFVKKIFPKLEKFIEMNKYLE